MKQNFCDWLNFFFFNYDLLNGHPFMKFRSPDGNKKMVVPIKKGINRVNPREANLLQLKNDQFRPRRIEQHLRHCDLVASDDPSFSKEY